MCAAPGMTACSAPWMPCARISAISTTSSTSSSPTSTSVGARASPSRSDEGGPRTGLLGAGVRAQEDLVRLALHGRDRRTQPRVDVLERAPRPRDPGLEHQLGRAVEVAGVEQIVLAAHDRRELLRPLEAAETTPGEDERADAVRMREREVERHASAEREARERRPLDREVV